LTYLSCYVEEVSENKTLKSPIIYGQISTSFSFPPQHSISFMMSKIVPCYRAASRTASWRLPIAFICTSDLFPFPLT
jgi:hypothetical protein